MVPVENFAPPAEMKQKRWASSQWRASEPPNEPYQSTPFQLARLPLFVATLAGEASSNVASQDLAR